ncbi:disulfide bond formation protein B [Metapseudomonas furukawaii]|jgi:disulfide bond formation protein DsbB|uniref:Disulfide bond formation protein B n=1 Tax=Metapseudomonas furukawaii TaxID=1149133 RepID=A0AAD1C6B2_METFU|nr:MULTISPECIES: disulfide bond formation protein B [Pseudomonas]ELS29700.1 Periplasmic thiol:disulfide oxidoreductase DsbB, required for DsbA reoxidation [Pseudomonas furukawaii]OWJ95517.1 disulfide bond formation protein B [Pseudomonas sp. A46]WAG78847.1 disulfide bond formation protein B [Pseudomonas furukawaii]BAU77178.1 periplasmic thiol:disulfide oxidoreductase DsbB [Pseudomonas furukawaii]
MSLASPRQLFLLAFLACVAVMGGALYLEHALGLEPCPLCIVQRVFIVAFGLVCLVAALHGPATIGRRVYAVLALLFSGLGAAAAGRQIWLQNIPADQLPACLPSFDYMIEAWPVLQILTTMLHGTADCAEVTWTLFGMSIPEWSLLAFAGCILFSLYQLLRRA